MLPQNRIPGYLCIHQHTHNPTQPIIGCVQLRILIRMALPCCPPGSLPSVSAAQAGATGPTTGEEFLLDAETRAYVARPPNKSEMKGAVLVFHDIFGYDSARTHHICDEIASWGYLVISPDFFGKELAGITDETDVFSIWAPWRLFTKGGTFLGRARIPFAPVEAKIRNLVMPWLEKECGPNVKIGTLGFCWGGWAITRAASLPFFSCAVGAHPSPDLQYLQSEGPTTAQLYEQIKVPILYLPGSNDPYWLKENGSVWAAIKKTSPESKCVTFPDMIHGWVNRGDIRVPNVKRDYEKAMEEIKGFYEKHLQSRL